MQHMAEQGPFKKDPLTAGVDILLLSAEPGSQGERAALVRDIPLIREALARIAEPLSDRQTPPSPGAVGEINDGTRVRVLMEMLDEDKAVAILKGKNWPDDRIVAALAAGGCNDGEIIKLLTMGWNNPWEYDRAIKAFSAAGFADERIVRAFRGDELIGDDYFIDDLEGVGWNDSRIIAALSKAGMTDCEIAKMLSDVEWEITETLKNACWDGQRIADARRAAGLEEEEEEEEENSG